MQTYDIPVNIKVLADTEEQAEEIVTHVMKHVTDKPALMRQVKEWDFIIYAFEENGDETDSAGV